MPEKIVVKGLHKIFGPKPDIAREMLKAGVHKDEIFKKTGMVVGVQDANFQIDEGEIFVIMGLSGSGKSTLIRLLNRLIEPTEGQILYNGRDIATMNKKQLIELRRRDMAMVFQSFALLPHLSVLDNAAFGLEVAGVERKTRERRALEVLEQVGLKAYAKKRPFELSGGMQQRVGLARALAVDPSLMLMDEAFSALDPLKRTEMQEVLLDLQKEQKRTVVFVSHDLDEAFRIGDRIAIMEGGRIVQIGTPEEILRNPADGYVRAFFHGVDVQRYRTARDVAQADEVPMVNVAADVAASFQTALRRLRERQCDYCFLVDSDFHLLGAVSAASIEHALQTGSVNLRDALLTDVQPVPGDTTLRQLIGHLVRNSCPVPVVDADERCLGAVTQTILLRNMANQESGNA